MTTSAANINSPIRSIGASNTSKDKRKSKGLTDESLLSKNQSKSVRYRIRVQTEKEADQEIKKFKDDKSRLS